MNEYFLDERRIYAPADSLEDENEGYLQLSIHDTGWTGKERNAMRQHGYDSMDALRAWLG